MTIEVGNAAKMLPSAEATIDSINDSWPMLSARFKDLALEVRDLSIRYRGATPFPHIVIDEFLPPQIADAVAMHFPSPAEPLWAKLPTEDQKRKLATADESQIPPLLRMVLFHLNSGAFLRLLEQLTGIDDLIADTKLLGGGLHQTLSGGKLAVHIDYSHHPQNGLFRRLNVILYVTKGWREEYGGHLELWDATMSRCEARIAPLFNRCAIFSTSEISFHGQPDPLRCPVETARKSLSLYYYTKNAPAGKESIVHNTEFKSRPGERIRMDSRLVRFASSALFRDLMPPLAYRAIRRLWNRRFSGK